MTDINQITGENTRAPKRLGLDNMHLNVFVAREVEKQKLVHTIQSANGKRPQLITISGESGVGKSELVLQASRHCIGNTSCQIVHGKVDQTQQNITHSAIIQALTSYVRNILCQGRSTLTQWKVNLLNVLNANAQIMIDIIPELELILGKQSAVEILPPVESKNRFDNIFRALIRAFAQNEKSLIIFLDDLQWCHEATINLIQSLLLDKQMTSFAIIAAYRSNEVAPDHPLLKMIDVIGDRVDRTHIALAPLTKQDVRVLSNKIFHPMEDNQQLSDLSAFLFNKSAGNPFFVKRLMQSLYRENQLHCDQQSNEWRFSIDEKQRILISSNIDKFINSELGKLPSELLILLQVGSCVGDRFDENILATVMNIPVERIAELLNIAFKHQLVFPTDDDKTAYSFSHDKVLQALQFMLSKAKKKQWCKAIGLAMIQNQEEQNLIEGAQKIVAYLNRAINLINEVELRHRVAQLNYYAAQKANRANGYSDAVYYLKFAAQLLPDNSWTEHYHLTYNVNCELVKNLYLSDDIVQSESVFSEAFTHAKTNIDRALLLHLQSTLQCLHEDNKLALASTLQGLKLLGVNMNKHPSKFSVICNAIRLKFKLLRKKNRRC